MHNRPNSPLELWGGVEGTYNRVGDRYFNQLEWSGHTQRVDDLDLFAELGIKAMRYPIIWDALAPDSPDQIDWTFPDERLNRLRELNIRPIVALVHHGSGPHYASITSPKFGSGLADFARRVAERFPWLDAYTPVNEPVTTARFSGLYGLWYPHGRDRITFSRLLINQCRAISEAMFAIREINPHAQLIQTEDLGRTYSTPKLAYQAEFDSNRRWLGFDLICGHVDNSHKMWEFLTGSGISPTELDWFCENPCPPDVIGIDYYPTSDRFLDENHTKYSGRCHVGNGRDPYVDIEAIRVMPKSINGFKERVCETWNRYGLPMAITEVHIGCSREEQLRWFEQAWRTAKELRQGGIPLQAVTAWALLGVWNWNSLVTRDDQHYEPGAFDTCGPSPRPTAIAHLLRAIGNEQPYDHPVLDQLGWWQRPHRILGSLPDSLMLHPPSPIGCGVNNRDKSSRALLIIDSEKQPEHPFVYACNERGLSYYLLSESDIDLNDSLSIDLVIDSTNPWLVIANLEQNSYLVEVCARHNIELVNTSNHYNLDACSVNHILDTIIDKTFDSCPFSQ